jgi:hypothetical protein
MASEFYPLPGSRLLLGETASGPIAVAQGGSHEGVLAQESGSQGPANTITAFRLNPVYSGTAPFQDWVTCNLGTIPGAPSPFRQGGDPHTVTAYQSPGGYQFPAGHAIAVLANTTPANYLALVDLDLMLGTTVSRYPGTHVCSGGVNGAPGNLPGPGSPKPVVTFVPL